MHKLKPVLLAVAPIICITACVDEDRTAKVSCTDPDRAILVDLGHPNSENRMRGALSALSYAPGTILELTSAALPNKLGSAKPVHVLSKSASDIELLQTRSTSGRIADAVFDVVVDPEVERAAKSLHVNLTQLITKNTALYSLSAARFGKSSDLLQRLNGDTKVISLLQEKTNVARFAVISATVHSEGIMLLYVPKKDAFVGVNTLKISNYYVHIRYDCNDVGAQGIGAAIADAPSEFRFFSYVPIAFDPLSRKIEVDTRPIDLLQFILHQ